MSNRLGRMTGNGGPPGGDFQSRVGAKPSVEALQKAGLKDHPVITVAQRAERKRARKLESTPGQIQAHQKTVASVNEISDGDLWSGSVVQIGHNATSRAR